MIEYKRSSLRVYYSGTASVKMPTSSSKAGGESYKFGRIFQVFNIILRFPNFFIGILCLFLTFLQPKSEVSNVIQIINGIGAKAEIM